jgi:hypothetical protein
MFEEAFVDVADLLDVECPIRQQKGSAVLFEQLQRAQQEKNRAVVDGKRGCSGIAPARAFLSPF